MRITVCTVNKVNLWCGRTAVANLSLPPDSLQFFVVGNDQTLVALNKAKTVLSASQYMDSFF